jgi:uncharacterized 2Fe-2S/4Fe-4S cluster protein (DUF4445 family)
MAVKLIINNRPIDAEINGLTIFDYAEQVGVRVPTSCKKQGKCKECVVEITQGAQLISPPNEFESHLPENFRLACQTKIIAQNGEVACHTMRAGEMRMAQSGADLSSFIIPRSAFTLDPAVRRDGDRILLDGQEIERSTGPIHGVAIDLGTTTITVRLLNLETGEIIADASFENPQRFGGSDVISRIHYENVHPGNVLMRIAAGYIKHALEDFGVDLKTIYEVVIAGNSAMRDLYFRLSVNMLGQNPYQSITEIELAEGKRTTTALTATAKQALLPIHPKARVYGMPIISGHVGADAAACMLAVNLAHEDRLVCIMDIGANTELILGNKNRILATSCPTVSAFEDGSISRDMPVPDGAITASLRILFQEYGIDYSNLDYFYLTGELGGHPKTNASPRIGFIPNLPDSKIVQIGNASLEGACIALLSQSKRAELESLAKRVEYCQLETHPEFSNFSVKGSPFKPLDSQAKMPHE